MLGARWGSQGDPHAPHQPGSGVGDCLGAWVLGVLWTLCKARMGAALAGDLSPACAAAPSACPTLGSGVCPSRR